MSTITSHIPNHPHHHSNTNPNTHRSTHQSAAHSTTTPSAATSRSSVSSPAAAPTPSSSACAACKYQRRKCTPDCPLAPYFPADQQRQFLNAHRLFGVSNILKILKSVDPDHHSEAMRSIIFQSNARANDPVGGCYRMVINLEQQVNTVYAELQLVLRQINFYRAQADAAANMASIQAAHDVHPSLLLSPAAVDEAAVYGNLATSVQQQQQYYNYFYYDQNGNVEHHDDDDNNHNNGVASFDININSVENECLDMELPPQILSLRQKAEGGAEDDVKPLVNDHMSELRHAFPINEEEGNSKDVNVASTSIADLISSKHEVKDDQSLMEQVEEHDLKSAASLFTLTNSTASPV